MKDRKSYDSWVPSYGAVVIQREPDGDYVLMVTGYRGLSFPKGHMEDGEEPCATAVREVKEETGIDIEVDTGISVTVNSALPGDRHTVTFFLGKSLSGKKEPRPQEDEVKEARWVRVEDVPSVMSHQPDIDAFQKLYHINCNRSETK